MCERSSSAGQKNAGEKKEELECNEREDPLLSFNLKEKTTQGSRQETLKTGFAKPAKYAIKSSHQNFFFFL